jgi:transposase-like protein
MRQKSSLPETPSERLVRDIRRSNRKQYSAEEKIRIALDGLRGEVSIAELCRREGIAESLKMVESGECKVESPRVTHQIRATRLRQNDRYSVD